MTLLLPICYLPGVSFSFLFSLSFIFVDTKKHVDTFFLSYLDGYNILNYSDLFLYYLLSAELYICFLSFGT